MKVDKSPIVRTEGLVEGALNADLILFRGKSQPEVVAPKPGAQYDAVWGNLFQTSSDFVALVYQGV